MEQDEVSDEGVLDENSRLHSWFGPNTILDVEPLMRKVVAGGGGGNEGGGKGGNGQRAAVSLLHRRST